jgi:hypothetical protein
MISASVTSANGDRAPRRRDGPGTARCRNDAPRRDPTVGRVSQARSRYHSAAWFCTTMPRRGRAPAPGHFGYVGGTWEPGHNRRVAPFRGKIERMVGARGLNPPAPTSLSRPGGHSGSSSPGPSDGRHRLPRSERGRPARLDQWHGRNGARLAAGYDHRQRAGDTQRQADALPESAAPGGNPTSREEERCPATSTSRSAR